MEAVVVLVGLNRKRFVRSIRDARGNVTTKLVFNQGEPVLVDDEALAAIKADIGHALMACDESASGQYKASEAATEALLKDLASPRPRGRKRASRAPAAVEEGEKSTTEVTSESEQPDG